MAIKLYEVVGDDSQFFWSVNPWKTRMCLNLKGLTYESVPLKYAQIPTVLSSVLQKSNGCTVPVLDDQGVIIQDSFKIAEYLDSKQPEPPIFHGDKPLQELVYNWIGKDFIFPLFKLTIFDIADTFDEESKEYFLRTRAEKFGDLKKWADEDRPGSMKTAQNVLGLLSQSFANNKYLSGEAIGWVDIVLASALHMFHLVNESVFEEVINGSTNPEAVKRWWRNMQVLIK